MLRILDQLLTTLLLTVSAALLVIWFRSYAVGDRYAWVEVMEKSDGGIVAEATELMTGEGGVSLSTSRRWTTNPESAERLRRRLHWWRFAPRGYATIDDPRYPWRDGMAPELLNVLGLQYHTESRTYGSTEMEHRVVVIPLWLPIALLSVYPLVRYFYGVLNRERAYLQMLGLCPRCSNDVRQTPDRCDVCGKRNPLGHAAPASPLPPTTLPGKAL